MVSPSKAKAAAHRPAPSDAPPRPKAPRAPERSPARPPVRQGVPDAPAMAPDPAAAAMAPLERLVLENPLQVIALLLWKERYRNPEFAVQIHPVDLAAFEACYQYLGIEPKVLIRRPPGVPAHPGLPRGHPRYPDGLAAAPEGAPKPYLQVSMVDAKTGDAFVPIESTEEGAKIRDRETQLRDLRARAPLLAQAVAGNAANNQFSQSEITDLCNAVILLARST